MSHSDYILGAHNNIDIENVYNDVIQSGVLGRSERLKKFLIYLLEQNSNGKTIKAYAIAVDVFNRSEDFDAGIDSIVRTETHRLRNRIEAYNSKFNKYEIHFPKGGFTLTIRKKPQIVSGYFQSKPLLKLLLPVIVLASFFMSAIVASKFALKKGAPVHQANCSDYRPNIFVESKSTVEASSANRLDRAEFFTTTAQAVIVQKGTFNLLSVAENCEETPTYKIELIVQTQLQEEFLAINVTDIRTSKELHRSITAVNDIQAQSGGLFSFVIRNISEYVQPDSSLVKNALDQSWYNSLAKKNMACWGGIYSAAILDQSEDFDTALECLEFVVQQESPYPENIALLAYFYVLQDIGAFPMSEARVSSIPYLISKAKSLDPKNHRVIITELFIETKKPDRSNQKIRELSARLESDFNLIQSAQIQRLFAISYTLGEWEAGVELSEYLKSITYQRDDSTLLFDAGYDLLFSSPEVAFATAKKQYSENGVHSNLTMLACANFAGDKDFAEKAVRALSVLGLNKKEDYIEHIKMRRFEPRITEKLITGVSIELH